MIKFFALLVLCLCQITLVTAQQTIECKCNRAHYSIEKYLSDADSISKILLKKYKKLMVIGVRGFAGANLMFVGELNGHNKAFSYDLPSKKMQTFEDVKLDKWKLDLMNDSTFLRTTQPNPGVVDHDIALYISFGYPYYVIREICGSDLMREPTRPFATALSAYLSDYAMPK